MSVFVLHDMLERVQAHATYRFVLSDEEDKIPRHGLLVGSHSMTVKYRELARHNIDLAVQALDTDIVYASSTSAAFKEWYDRCPQGIV